VTQEIPESEIYKQEPVAWLYVNADMPTNRQLEWTETHHGYAGNWLKYPLYAAPPAAQEPVAWQQELGNILCLIHRDGGDYISEHGWRKAIDDADLKVAKLNAESDTSSEQKPVAYKWKGELFTPGEIEMLDVDDAVPLYQNPQPVECMCGICKLGKREWVGLTNEEIEAVMHGSVEGERMLPYQFARATEAKLKAKNETT